MSTNEAIVIVSGLPRSGTSMMMRMLEAGGLQVVTDGQRVADDDNLGGYYEFEPIKQLGKSKEWLKDARGKAVKAIYQLLYELPEDYQYQVIFMNRKLEEVVASQRKMLENLGRDDGGIPDEKMIELLRRQVSKAKAWLASQSNFSVLDIDYNEMLRDASPSIQRIGEFLGRELDPSAMGRVVEPAHYRNRR